jgi:hypothetical protein
LYSYDSRTKARLEGSLTLTSATASSILAGGAVHLGTTHYNLVRQIVDGTCDLNLRFIGGLVKCRAV